MHRAGINMYSSGGRCGDKASIGIDHKFDCVHRSDWHRIYRNPDSSRAFTKPSLSDDLGCGYQRNHHANSRLAYRVQNNQGAIKPVCASCDDYQFTMRLRQLPTV